MAERLLSDRHNSPGLGPEVIGYRLGRKGCGFESRHSHFKDEDMPNYRWVAQLVEQRSPKPQTVGSTPAPPATYITGSSNR